MILINFILTSSFQCIHFRKKSITTSFPLQRRLFVVVTYCSLSRLMIKHFATAQKKQLFLDTIVVVFNFFVDFLVLVLLAANAGCASHSLCS